MHHGNSGCSPTSCVPPRTASAPIRATPPRSSGPSARTGCPSRHAVTVRTPPCSPAGTTSGSPGTRPTEPPVDLTHRDRRRAAHPLRQPHPDWLRSGQALQRVLRHAAAHDVMAAFHTQPLELPEPRAAGRLCRRLRRNPLRRRSYLVEAWLLLLTWTLAIVAAVVTGVATAYAVQRNMDSRRAERHPFTAALTEKADLPTSATEHTDDALPGPLCAGPGPTAPPGRAWPALKRAARPGAGPACG